MKANAQDIKQIMAKVWEIDVSGIPDTVALGQFRAWDSLGHVTLLTELENIYSLELNEDTIMAMQNIEKILEIINS